MKPEPAPTSPIPLRFNLRETSGAFGDLGTFLPIVVALAVTTGLDLAAMLLFAGLMNILTGLWFRQPLAVQPMKAIAAIAIADGLSGGSVVAAGLIMGVLILLIGVTGLADRLARWVPVVIIRGLQLGVGLKLALAGLSTTIPDQPAAALPWLGITAIALLLFAPLFHPRTRNLPTLLIVVTLGLILAWFQSRPTWQPTLPIQLMQFQAGDFTTAAWSLVPAQLPLTLLNSVLAVCLLSEDLYPKRGIRPDRMAASVGLMNLVTLPFGAMPVCHGSGGLAAQHAFGARTGGSAIILGVAKIVAAILLGAAAAPLLAAFPKAILGLLLIAAGLRLAYQARLTTWRRPSHALTLIAMAAAILLGQTLLAVLILTALWFIFSRSPNTTTPPAAT